MLMHGSGFKHGKKRIYEIYQNISSKSKRATAIKKEYGQGGCGWPLEGYGLHGYDTFTNGIRLQWRDENGEHEDSISWANVEKYIGILIENGTYYQPVITRNEDLWNAMFSDIPIQLVS